MWQLHEARHTKLTQTLRSRTSLAFTRLYRPEWLPPVYDWGSLSLLTAHVLLGESVLTQQLKDKKSSKAPYPRPSRC